MNDHPTHADLTPRDNGNTERVLQEWNDQHETDDVLMMGDVFHASLKPLVQEHFGTLVFDVETTTEQTTVEYTQFDIDSIMNIHGMFAGSRRRGGAADVSPLWHSLRALVDAEIAKAHTHPGRQA
jgi:hypothetical protein